MLWHVKHDISFHRYRGCKQSFLHSPQCLYDNKTICSETITFQMNVADLSYYSHFRPLEPPKAMLT